MPRKSDIFCLGISHRNASVHVREKLALTSAREAELYAAVTGSAALQGLVILSTCNRVEFYGSATIANDGLAELRQILTDLGRLPEEVLPALYSKTGIEVAEHISRVAAGLDAMVLGEAQILGQLDVALEDARRHKGVDGHLESLFRFALKAGRRARAETRIGHNAVSVSSVAVRKAEAVLGSLEGKTVSVVGLGETGRLVLKVLRSRSSVEVILVNRTLKTAVVQATSLDAEVLAFAEMGEVLLRSDVIFSCTGCPLPIIEERTVERAMKSRAGRPLLLVDLAVPHDIEPEVARVEGVTHMDVDAMQVEISGSLRLREAAIPSVEAILEEERERFESWLQVARVQPLITDLRRQAENIRKEELARLAGRLPELPEELREHIDRFSQSLVQKLFHNPTTGIKREASTGDPEDLARTVRSLFKLRDVGS
ncbi:MAG: glutamyl-tRNA reductase [Rhodothermales bacterium]|jgi:glutamyl-tRNA reductase